MPRVPGLGRSFGDGAVVVAANAGPIDIWMMAPALEALRLQRPLADNALIVVARGEKQDPPAASGTLSSEKVQTVDAAQKPMTQPTLWEVAPEE